MPPPPSSGLLLPGRRLSIDGHRLGEVSREVRVDSAQQGELVSNQLEREHRNQRGKRPVARNDDRVVVEASSQLRIVGDDGDLPVRGARERRRRAQAEQRTLARARTWALRALTSSPTVRMLVACSSSRMMSTMGVGASPSSEMSANGPCFSAPPE